MTPDRGRGDDVRALWQEQTWPDAGHAVSSDALRERARALDRSFVRKDLIIYGCGVTNVVAFGAVIWFQPGLRLVSALVIATALAIVTQYRRRRPLRMREQDLTTTACLDFYRASLQRKRDFSRTIGRWFFPPAIAGQLLLMIGLLAAPPGVPRRWIWMALPFWIALDVIIFAAAWRKHQAAASRAERELMELDALGRER
jgi:hypothetical protein